MTRIAQYNRIDKLCYSQEEKKSMGMEIEIQNQADEDEGQKEVITYECKWVEESEKAEIQINGSIAILDTVEDSMRPGVVEEEKTN